MRKIFARRPKIKQAVLSISGKGGVGKSLQAASLANLLAEEFQVGLLDCDVRAPNIPAILRIEADSLEYKRDKKTRLLQPQSFNGFQVFSTSFFLGKHKAINLTGAQVQGLVRQAVNDVAWGPNLDFLVCDMPPSTSDAYLTMRQLFKKLHAVIIASSDISSLRDCARMIHSCITYEIPILGMVGNLVGSECPSCGCTIHCLDCGEKISFGESANIVKLASEFGVKYLGDIRFNPGIKKRMDQGQPFLTAEALMKAVALLKEV